MGKSTKVRFSSEKKLAIVREYKQASPDGKKAILEKYRIFRAAISSWARGSRLYDKRKSRVVNVPSDLDMPARREFHPNKKLQAEVDRLQMENTVLRANLTMAMRAGYLDFLTLESPSVKR